MLALFFPPYLFARGTETWKWWEDYVLPALKIWESWFDGPKFSVELLNEQPVKDFSTWRITVSIVSLLHLSE